MQFEIHNISRCISANLSNEGSQEGYLNMVVGDDGDFVKVSLKWKV